MKTEYVIVIENAGKNLSGWFPDVPGTGTTGKSVEQVLERAVEALEAQLDDENHAPPAARSLKAILDEGIELQGGEIFATVIYERKALEHA